MSSTSTTTLATLRSPSPSTANPPPTTSTNGTITLATTTSPAEPPTPKPPRVRFDAECILIPESLSTAKRPKLSSKSYSLPLWRKGRDRDGEEEESHVVLKVNFPSFKSKKSPSSHSRERDQRNPSRSPPAIAPHVPSCLRASSSSGHPLPQLPVQAPLTTLIAVYSSPSSSSPASLSSSAAAPPPITIPLRSCCPECAAHADAQTEEFSRGAMRVRRRGMGFGVGSLVGADNMLYSPSPVADDPEGDKLVSGSGVANVNRLVAELEERKRRSRSGTPSPIGTPPISPISPHPPGRVSPSLLGPALVRVVEGRIPYGDLLSASSAEALLPHPSSSVEALVHDGARTPSPLLPLGIAVDEVDKERRRRSIDAGVAVRHGNGTGVYVLAEEDDEALQELWLSSRSGSRKASPSATPRPHGSPADSPSLGSRRPPLFRTQAYVDDDEADLFPLPSASSSKPPTPVPTPPVSRQSTPPGSSSDVSLHRLAASASDGGPGRASPLLRDALANANQNVKPGHRRSVSASSPTSLSIGKGHAPGMSDAARERSRSEAVCVALGGMGRRERERKEREREGTQTPTQEGALHDRECSNASVSSISTSVSLPSPSQLHNHKAAKCERGLLLPPGDERDFAGTDARGRSESASLSSVPTSRSSSRDSVDRSSDAESSTSSADKPSPNLPRLATSVIAAGLHSPALAPRLPAHTFGALAVPSESEEEVSPIGEESEPEQVEQDTLGKASGSRFADDDTGIRKAKRASLHLRIASAPAAAQSSPSPTTDATTDAPPVPALSSSPTKSASAPPVPASPISESPVAATFQVSKTVVTKAAPPLTTRNGRGKSASSSATITPPAAKPTSSPAKLKAKPRSSSTAGSTNPNTKPSPSPPSPAVLRRTNSLARIRSTSTSSIGKATGRKVFGGLVDVLRGVASVGRQWPWHVSLTFVCGTKAGSRNYTPLDNDNDIP
ncbi:hypothetical protein MKEN_00612700 [Mycena kentingensis (nom. inval.)]|nr:hypothetical protein MKEN_00612700 [Mycena kentingensis (nom. inval.)]